jgi:hypothetical protein
MTSLPTSPPDNTTIGVPVEHLNPQDVEDRAMLGYSILDHRMAVRDRYEGAQRAAFVVDAIREACMALNGATIETILEARQ